jgi:hypothetical protein
MFVIRFTFSGGNMQLRAAALKTGFTWGAFIRSMTIRYRKHLVDLLKKLIFLVQDLGRSLMNEKNAHQLPPPINPQMRPQRAAMKNVIG